MCVSSSACGSSSAFVLAVFCIRYETTFRNIAPFSFSAPRGVRAKFAIATASRAYAPSVMRNELRFQCSRPSPRSLRWAARATSSRGSALKTTRVRRRAQRARAAVVTRAPRASLAFTLVWGAGFRGGFLGKITGGFGSRNLVCHPHFFFR